MKDDTISRQAALDALGERPVVWSDNDDYTLGERNQYDMDRLAIETVPSAQSSATDTNVGDNLSVDELIKFLNPESNYVFYDDAHGFCINTQDVLAHLCAMPSAQPSISKTEMVGDTISRQGVLRLLNAVPSEEFATRAMLIIGVNALPPEQPVEDARAMCSECDAWNKYKNYPQPEQFNPCTVCQEFDCTGCKFRRT